MIRNVARAEQELLEGQKISIVIDDAVKGCMGRGRECSKVWADIFINYIELYS